MWLIFLLGPLTEEHVGDDAEEDDCEACVEEVDVLIDRHAMHGIEACGQRL